MSSPQFLERLSALSRDELLDIIKQQDPSRDGHLNLFAQIRRIEWVFENKLTHLTWPDGSVIEGRPLTNEELCLLIDEPFTPDNEMTRAGISVDNQKQIHIAADPVLWAKNFLNVHPRAYQILMLRHPSLRKVLRAGRRLGKTYTMSILLLHYSYTHKDGKCIVVAPMKSQAEVLYKEIMRLAKNSTVVKESIVRNVQSPQFNIELSNGSSILFFTSGMRCLTPDHDVLTKDGWKPINDVVENELILAWDDGKYRWQPVTEKHEYDFHGDLVVHEGKQISFRVTPNHKLIAKTRAPDSEWRDVHAEDLKDYYIPTAGLNPDLGSGTHYSNDELELWGWWLAEGSGFIGNAARLTQKKEPGLSRIVELAKKLGYNPQVYTYGDKASEIRILGWKPPIYSGTNSYNKFIPREIMDNNNVWALLEGLLGGDGWCRRKGWEYSSSSFQLANDVQEIAIRNSYRANIREKIIRYTPVDGGLPNRHWIVSIYPYKESLINPDLLKREHYEGKVHCVTVDSGYFLTRHNGLTHVTGNSGGKADVVRGQEAHVIVLDELDYMHADDLESLYAMLMKTAEDQEDKILVGASTPTGRHEHFYDWCNSPDFKEFWFPSYCNPFFSPKDEKEFHLRYSEMGYRHEIEADWGEDVDGVYPRKYVDIAFHNDGWEYIPDIRSARSFFVMGVDWDKYGAGVNMVILEVCEDNYEDDRFQNKIRLAYREEFSKGEFTYTESIKRVIELNEIFQPRHIYVDRGSGEVQVELLHKYGIENPESKLRKRVEGYSSSETIEVRDPHTKQPMKKKLKPFMVDNLCQMLEDQRIVFPSNDDDKFRDNKSLYKQLISYVVIRTSQAGDPVFEASGTSEDHAHDALILACLAISKNYSDLLKVNVARRARAVSSDTFLPIFTLDDPNDEKIAQQVWGMNVNAAPVEKKRSFAGKMSKKNPYRPIQRKSF